MQYGDGVYINAPEHTQSSMRVRPPALRTRKLSEHYQIIAYAPAGGARAVYRLVRFDAELKSGASGMALGICIHYMQAAGIYMRYVHA